MEKPRILSSLNFSGKGLKVLLEIEIGFFEIKPNYPLRRFTNPWYCMENRHIRRHRCAFLKINHPDGGIVPIMN